MNVFLSPPGSLNWKLNLLHKQLQNTTMVSLSMNCKKNNKQKQMNHVRHHDFNSLRPVVLLDFKRCCKWLLKCRDFGQNAGNGIRRDSIIDKGVHNTHKYTNCMGTLVKHNSLIKTESARGQRSAVGNENRWAFTGVTKLSPSELCVPVSVHLSQPESSKTVTITAVLTWF